MNRYDMPLRLIEPRIDLEESHKTFLQEFLARGERVHPSVVATPYENFADYIAMLDAASKGVGIPSEIVAHSTYWLIDADEQIVAISNLRHELNDFLRTYGGHIGYGVRPSARRRGHAKEILRQTLQMAKKRGINRILLTCSKDNPASAKTILRNGGKLQDEEFMPEYEEVICRYWIDVSAAG